MNLGLFFLLAFGVALIAAGEEDAFSAEWWLKMVGVIILCSFISSAYDRIAELKKELETIRTYR